MNVFDSATLTAWTVAFAEGFSTLAVEVIAIRLAIPVAGSSMTLTGVMLGVVLFALSAGYWHGGILSARWESSRTRAALTRNLLFSGLFYAAISFPAEAILLGKLLDAGLGLALAIGVAATATLAVPVYLVAQTVPLLAELTNNEGKAGKASGKVLFYSTIGSVAGGIVTPIFLFPHLGVHGSTYVVCSLLFGASALMASRWTARWKILLAGTLALAAVHMAGLAAAPANQQFSFDSAHQNIRIVVDKDPAGRMERVMYLNGGRASGIFCDTGQSSFEYVREAGRMLSAVRSSHVLAIGAAGFTFPRDAAALPFVTQVDAVDVDPMVRQIAERHFLRQLLPAKIRFFPLSARYALRQLRQQGMRYGFTLLDAYSGMGVPDELLTVDFFRDVRTISERVAANLILDRKAESEFASNVLASFQKEFGHVWLKDVKPGDEEITNFLVTNWEVPGSAQWTGRGRIYTDDRNTADRDHVDMIWGSGD
jgi:predicted membrane-bound spermidine synthase